MTFLQQRFLLLIATALFLLPPAASAATLAASSARPTISVGDTLIVTVVASSPDQALNAISGQLSFPTDLLAATSVSKDNSILTLWVQQPTLSNSSGTVDFSGIVPNPGYTGIRGQVFFVQFRAKQAGLATISFASSAILANDGNGTNILTAATPQTITITAAQLKAAPTPASNPISTSPSLIAHITSATHPDQSSWYVATHVVLDWTNAQDVSTVRIGYDRAAKGTPTVVYAPAISHKELDLASGIWYFHVAEKGPSGWGPVSTFKIQIDTDPPLPITTQFPDGATTSASTITTRFGTSDALSGIDHYDVSVDGADRVVSAGEGNNIYSLPAGDAGTHALMVTAYDKAGNTARANTQFYTVGTPLGPTFPSLAWLLAHLSLILAALALLLLVALIEWYLWHRFRIFRHRVIGHSRHPHLVLQREFARLKNAVIEELATLENIKSRRALTLEEERLIIRLQKIIDASERVIEREIDDEINKTRRSSRA